MIVRAVERIGNDIPDCSKPIGRQDQSHVAHHIHRIRPTTNQPKELDGPERVLVQRYEVSSSGTGFGIEERLNPLRWIETFIKLQVVGYHWRKPGELQLRRRWKSKKNRGP